MLKKENTMIDYSMGMDFAVAIPAKKTSRKKNLKKQFKKALARKLGMKYGVIKNLFPKCLNSTMIANYLQPAVAHFTHEDIRNISQQLKLEFDIFR